MQGTRGEQRNGEPADEVLMSPTPIRDWFLRPPFPGTLLVVVLFGLLFVGAMLIGRSRNTPPDPPQVAFSPVLAPPQRQEEPPVTEEAPVVTIRPLPGKAPKPPVIKPELTTPPVPGQIGNAPLAEPAAPATQPVLPGGLSGAPDAAPAPGDVPVEPTPAEAPRAETPPLEIPRPEPARPEPARPEPPREEPVRPRPRIARTPPVRIVRPTGRLTVFFDADSSTFDRHDERLPLRVQVFVDGQKRLESDDPEKHEFDLGDLPEGRHEVVVVPFVGRNQPEPRRVRVDIDAETDNRFKAVLRREDGMARVSKFRPRD